jgi:hypothetical protein
VLDVVRLLQIPLLFLGPYSYDCAPAEMIFSKIKSLNLNQQMHSFSNRSGFKQYLLWLAHTMQQIRFQDVRSLFVHTIRHAERYLLF